MINKENDLGIATCLVTVIKTQPREEEPYVQHISRSSDLSQRPVYIGRANDSKVDKRHISASPLLLLAILSDSSSTTLLSHQEHPTHSLGRHLPHTTGQAPLYATAVLSSLKHSSTKHCRGGI